MGCVRFGDFAHCAKAEDPRSLWTVYPGSYRGSMRNGQRTDRSGSTLDLIAGPETTQLTDIQVSRSQAHTGIFSLHYYLEGTDEQGDHMRLEISGDDYTRLSESRSATAKYYRRTGRVLSVQGNL